MYYSRNGFEEMKTFATRLNNTLSLYTNYIGPLNAHTTGKYRLLFHEIARLLDEGLNTEIRKLP